MHACAQRGLFVCCERNHPPAPLVIHSFISIRLTRSVPHIRCIASGVTVHTSAPGAPLPSDTHPRAGTPTAKAHTSPTEWATPPRQPHTHAHTTRHTHASRLSLLPWLTLSVLSPPLHLCGHIVIHRCAERMDPTPMYHRQEPGPSPRQQRRQAGAGGRNGRAPSPSPSHTLRKSSRASPHTHIARSPRRDGRRNGRNGESQPHQPPPTPWSSRACAHDRSQCSLVCVRALHLRIRARLRGRRRWLTLLTPRAANPRAQRARRAQSSAPRAHRRAR